MTNTNSRWKLVVLVIFKAKNSTCMKVGLLYLFSKLCNHQVTYWTIRKEFRKYWFLYKKCGNYKQQNHSKNSFSVLALYCSFSWYIGVTYLLSVDKRFVYSFYEGALSLPTVTSLRQILCTKLCLPRSNKECAGRFIFCSICLSL